MTSVRVQWAALRWLSENQNKLNMNQCHYPLITYLSLCYAKLVCLKLIYETKILGNGWYISCFFILTFQSITLRRLYLISVKCGAIPFNLLCRVQDCLQWNSARIRSKRSCDTREKSCESTTSISTSWWVILIMDIFIHVLWPAK